MKRFWRGPEWLRIVENRVSWRDDIRCAVFFSDSPKGFCASFVRGLETVGSYVSSSLLPSLVHFITARTVVTSNGATGGIAPSHHHERINISRLKSSRPFKSCNLRYELLYLDSCTCSVHPNSICLHCIRTKTSPLESGRNQVEEWTKSKQLKNTCTHFKSRLTGGLYNDDESWEHAGQEMAIYIRPYGAPEWSALVRGAVHQSSELGRCEGNILQYSKKMCRFIKLFSFAAHWATALRFKRMYLIIWFRRAYGVMGDKNNFKVWEFCGTGSVLSTSSISCRRLPIGSLVPCTSGVTFDTSLKHSRRTRMWNYSPDECCYAFHT